MLVAQAELESLVLLIKDAAFRRFPVRLLIDDHSKIQGKPTSEVPPSSWRVGWLWCVVGFDGGWSMLCGVSVVCAVKPGVVGVVW